MADQTPGACQMPDLIPSLVVRDTQATLTWFEKLGFHTLYTMPGPDGSIVHAHVVRDGAHLMLGPTCAESQMEPGATGLQLYISLHGQTADELHTQAQREGIAITEPPTDQF